MYFNKCKKVRKKVIVLEPIFSVNMHESLYRHIDENAVLATNNFLSCIVKVIIDLNFVQ